MTKRDFIKSSVASLLASVAAPIAGLRPARASAPVPRDGEIRIVVEGGKWYWMHFNHDGPTDVFVDGDSGAKATYVFSSAPCGTCRVGPSGQMRVVLASNR